ncbi:tetratricopeptide repeat protein [Aliinostoc sp. HNIBRCY26]|uniref:tetratricopeptide repeat protein n=1 Tax=Aliinostoc sp. HNIBRCY26 TaxID=3418997 RepID=UPI003D03FB6A
MIYLEQGLIAYKKGDYHTAKKIFTRLAILNRKAANYDRTAATAGHPQAAYDLAALGRGFEQNYTTSLSWYRRAAEAGVLEAMFVMGTMYANGEGVTQDFEKAEKWWLKAAAQNHAIASFYIGHLYNNGDGRERNPATAAYWYLKAWDAGHDLAEIYLANLLPSLEELARGGAAEAQAVLGAIHYTIYGNYLQAINWLQLATAQGHPEATRLLGYCYEQGGGVE